MLCDKLPRLCTYQDAMTHYFTVKPYARGKNKGSRPLGKSRRHDRSQIGLFSHGQPDEHIVLSLYGYSVVVRHASGFTSLSTCGYNTSTTLQFLQDTTTDVNNTGISFLKHGGAIYARDKNGHNHRLHSGRVVVTPDGKVSGGGAAMSLVLDRAKFKEVLQPYAEFISYCKKLATLEDEVDPNELYVALRDSGELLHGQLHVTVRSRRFAMQPDAALTNFALSVRQASEMPEEEKLQRYYVAYQRLLHSMQRSYSRKGHGIVVINSPQRITKQMHDVIKHIHGKELFNNVAVTNGKLPNVSNKKYL